MRVEAYGTTDVGCKREANEDHLLVMPELVDGVGLFIVADGVGGEAGGGAASRAFVDLVLEGIQQNIEAFEHYNDDNDRAQRDLLLHTLKRVLSSVNYDLYAEHQANARQMGATTGLVAISVGQGVFIGHAGDCRAYLLRGGQTYQLTADHTFAQKLLDEGLLQREDLATFPYKNVVTRAFGREPVIDVDTLFVDCFPGDRMILCSDGLHGLVPWDELAPLSSLFPDPRHLSDHLISEANRRGGHDNITALTMDVHGEHEPSNIDLDRKLDLMRNMFLFQNLTDQELMKVLRIVYEQRFAGGTPIIVEGTEGTEIYLLAEGIVDVSLNGAYLTSIAAGGHFGELALIEDGFRSASVTARRDCFLLTIHRDGFESLLASDHLLATKLLGSFLRNVAGRVRDLSHELSESRKA